MPWPLTDRLEPRKKQELRHLGVRLIEVAVPAELPPGPLLLSRCALRCMLLVVLRVQSRRSLMRCQ